MSESSFQFTALLEADALADVGTPGNLLVVASFSERQKSRHKTQTQCGKPVGWFLPRGLVLKEGDVLLCRSGVRSIAAAKRATELGMSAYNILEGFEGSPDASAHRGALGGWRKHGLPWRQN